ncbi:MAG: 3-dehydroquinate synthase [Eggerthellaceae bacterium]|nr:3-dehydroquinate synthase [Eggerthellaceae bacterium]
MPTSKVVVNLREGCSYDIRIGSGIIAGIGAYIKKIPSIADACHIAIITDNNVAPLYLDVVSDSFTEAGYEVSGFTFEAGEENKTLKCAQAIIERMCEENLDRKTVVVGLGGGVVCDMAGFIASVFLRGVACVYVPTSLLAMVDASVGGKTGVNTKSLKNAIGTFCQPAYVCADLDTLKTLDERQWKSGCAEIVKTAMVCGDDLFFEVSERAQEIKARDIETIGELITACVTFKAEIVSLDERDTQGVRACLNYGHTLGHALEELGQFKTFTHGEAVACGMRFAAMMSADCGMMEDQLRIAQNELLDDLGLVSNRFDFDEDEIVCAMHKDKKNRDGIINMVLPEDVGRCEVVPVDDKDIAEALSAFKERF